MRFIRSLALLAAGIVIGMFMMQPGAAQQEKAKGLRLNHVGMYVKNFDESINFYTKTMGFREAFAMKDKEGKPTLTYLQINKDTFLEIAPATAERPDLSPLHSIKQFLVDGTWRYRCRRRPRLCCSR